MKRLLIAIGSIVSAPAFAGDLIFSNAVPTLDDLGLAVLSLIVAVTGAAVVRRHRKR